MNITEAKGVFLPAYYADDTVIMKGVHGIGKSDVVKAFAEENDFRMETLFLSHQEVGDLIGMPRTIEEDGEILTAWTKPVWFQRIVKAAEQGKRTVLFLDELNRAPIDVRQTALQLVLERQIHEHILPKDSDNRRTFIVAAINPSDDYQVDELDTALLDRFLSLDVEADVKAWLDWSLKRNVNQIVRDFIIDNPTKLWWQPAESEHDSNIGASPRSWTKLATFIDNIDDIPGELHFPIIKGKIGPELGGQFLSHLKNYAHLVRVQDIEVLVKKLTKNGTKTVHIEKIGDAIAELTKKTEAIQKRDLVDQLVEKYISDGKNPKPNETLPLMGMLYSVPIETLNGFLSTFKTDKPNYAKLRDIDKELNNKGLFMKVISAIDY